MGWYGSGTDRQTARLAQRLQFAACTVTICHKAIHNSAATIIILLHTQRFLAASHLCPCCQPCKVLLRSGFAFSLQKLLATLWLGVTVVSFVDVIILLLERLNYNCTLANHRYSHKPQAC